MRGWACRTPTNSSYTVSDQQAPCNRRVRVGSASACSSSTWVDSIAVQQPRRQHTARSRGTLQVYAIDAAQPFDFEARAKKQISSDSRLRVGIVGFGTFGQFLAKRLVARGHQVIATSRTPYDEVARKLGVGFFNDLDDFCEEHPEVVLLASSILSTKDVLRSLPVQRLKRNTLFVDVLSVKVFPKKLFTSELPPEVDVLCTHPMFGPDSGKGSWAGLNFMYERVRIGPGVQRQRRVDNFLKIFRDEGCNMVEMTCEEHDRQAASTQFITHTVGRILGAMQLTPSAINTKGFEALLNLVNNTNNDSFDLYYGLFLYNRNATDELDRLEQAVDAVKKELFGRLHDLARKQLFPDDAEESPTRFSSLAPRMALKPTDPSANLPLLRNITMLSSTDSSEEEITPSASRQGAGNRRGSNSSLDPASLPAMLPTPDRQSEGAASTDSSALRH